MATRNKTKAPAKKAPKPRAARRTARGTTASRLDHFLELQQRTIGRYASLAAGAVDRIAAGDFNIPRWANDYSTSWGATAEDLSRTTRAMLLAPAPQRGKGAGRKASRRSSEAVLRNWLSLQQSVVSRVANYYRGVGELVAAGAGEPREWIAGGATFWSDVLADVSDWAHRESGDALRPTAEWLPRLRKAVRQGKLTEHVDIAFTVPSEAFSDEAGPDARITLFTDGLIRVGGGVSLMPHQNVELTPPTVTRSSPSSELKLFDLPGSLVPGDVYAGLVWAKETRFPVASIEVQIV